MSTGKAWDFIHHVAANAACEPGLRDISDYLDLGTKDATNGNHIAHAIRAKGRKNLDKVQQWHIHECNFRFVYVLNGSATFKCAGQDEKTICQGDHILQIPMIPHREIACSEDFEVFEIVAPADFKTRLVDPRQGLEASG